MGVGGGITDDHTDVTLPVGFIGSGYEGSHGVVDQRDNFYRNSLK